MKYEARLMASEWINGSGWNYENDEVNSWAVQADQVDAWKEMIKSGDKSLFDYITDGLDDEEYDEDLDDSGNDIKYTMELVEIDEDDFLETGKAIASTSIWWSELVSKNEEENQMKNISINNGVSYCTIKEALEAVGMDEIVSMMDDDVREEVANEWQGDEDDHEGFIAEYLRRAPEDLIIG